MIAVFRHASTTIAKKTVSCKEEWIFAIGRLYVQEELVDYCNIEQAGELYCYETI